MAMAEVENREWYLASYAPIGVPNSDHLKLRTVTLSLKPESIPNEHVAFQVLYVSIDPYVRTQLSGRDDGLSLPQIPLGQVIRAFGIGKVVRSKDAKFSEGEIVMSRIFPVAEFGVMTSNLLQEVNSADGVALPDYLSCLGMTGITAWVGIKKIGNAQPGSNVYISAAAGGVGIIAGQLAKVKGCRVVESVGSDDKVKLLKEECGYDDAFNYRIETDYDAALTKYFPDGIDVYFDNVGGKMLEAVLNHVNHGARIALCGMISEYNKVFCPNLEELCISRTDSITALCSHQLPTGFFNKLKELEVWKCQKLRNLMSPSVARGVLNLRLLKIGGCRSIEEVITEEEQQGEEMTNESLFPRLEELVLFELPKLLHFFQTKHDLEFPFLREVEIRSCTEMKTFIHLGSVSTSSLKSLVVEEPIIGGVEVKDGLNKVIHNIFISKEQETSL